MSKTKEIIMGRFNDVICDAGMQRILGNNLQDYLTNDDYRNANTAFDSGIIQSTDRAREFALGKNKTGQVDFWLPPDYVAGGVPNCADPTDTTGQDCAPIGLNSGSETLFKLGFSKSFAMDYCETQCLNANEDDPLTVVRDRIIGPEMRRQYTHYLLSMLSGLYKNAAADTVNGGQYIVDLGTETLDRATSTYVEDLREAGSFDGIMVHRELYLKMKREAYLSEKVCCEHTMYEYDSLDGNTKIIPIGKPYGDLYLKDENGAFISYAFDDGAFEYAEGVHPRPIAVDYVEDANCNDGQELLFARTRFVLRPMATSFTGTPARDYPTLTELRDGANWKFEREMENFALAFVKSA